MKKIAVILLILTLLLCGCGKSAEVTYSVTEVLIEMPQVNRTTHYVHTLDDQGRTLSTTVSSDGEVWSQMDYRYSEDNTVVSITTTSDGQTATGESRRVFDKEGNVIKQETWEDGKQTDVSYRHYDEDGRLQEAATTYFGGYMRGYKQTFAYDSQGNQISVVSEMTTEADTALTKTETRYDSQNRRAKEVNYRDDTITDFTDFNWEGNVETGLRYTPDGNVDAKWVSTYDDQGNLLCQEIYNSDGILGTRTSYCYVGSDGSISGGIKR